MTSKTRQQSALLSYITEHSVNSGYSTTSLDPLSLTNAHASAPNHKHENGTSITFCKWLDCLIYSQLFRITQGPRNKCRLRSKIINFVGISVSLFFLALIVYNFCMFAITSALTPSFINSKSDGSERFVFKVNIILQSLFITLCRLLQMYYFIFKFNFPWYNSKLLHYHPNLSTILQQYINSNIKILNKRLIVYVMISIILFVGWSVFLVINLLLLDHILTDLDYKYWPTMIPGSHILFVIPFFFVQVPTVLFPIIWSVIAFKLQFRLYYLQCLMNKSEYTPDFVQILEQYKSFYHQFKKEHKFWKLYMLLYMCHYGSFLWISIDVIIKMGMAPGKVWDGTWDGFFSIHNDIVIIVFLCFGVFVSMMPLIGYIISSSGMNYEYNQFFDIFQQYEDNAEACKSNYRMKKQIPEMKVIVSDNDTTTSTLPFDFAHSNYSQSVLIRKKSISSSESFHLLSRYGSKRKKHHMETPNYTVDVNELRTIVYNANHFHLLANYVSRFAIQAKLCGVELRTVAILRFLAVFLILKWISYMTTFLIEPDQPDQPDS